MYFQVYAVHSKETCPMYTPEKMPEVLAAWEKFGPLADEHKVKIHYMAASSPSHEFFFFLESDSMSAISQLMFSIPIRQDVKIVPVELIAEEHSIKMAKAVMAAKE